MNDPSLSMIGLTIHIQLLDFAVPSEMSQASWMSSVGHQQCALMAPLRLPSLDMDHTHAELPNLPSSEPAMITHRRLELISPIRAEAGCGLHTTTPSIDSIRQP